MAETMAAIEVNRAAIVAYQDEVRPEDVLMEIRDFRNNDVRPEDVLPRVEAVEDKVDQILKVLENNK